jgi:hypothetical protein
MKRSIAGKRISEMSADDLARATADLDREFVVDTFEPPGATEAARWRRVARKRGRPRVGQGVKVISVSVEKGLLAESDALARSLRVRRATLIARGLRAVLASEGRRRIRP